MRGAFAARPDLDPTDPRMLVVAAGKAAAGMLRGLGAHAAPRISRAIALLPAAADASGLPPTVELLRGGHPVPTAEGCRATLRILEEVRQLREGDRLLLLLSGGASALLEAPADGLDIDDLVETHRELVASGLAIRSINLIRGCLSTVKAGRLAAAAEPARTTTLAISDVEGDDPEVIGSGPTVAPAQSLPERCQLALDIIAGTRMSLPSSALRLLERSCEASDPVTKSKQSPADYTVVASIGDAIGAAKAELVRRGYRILSSDTDRMYGDTSSVAARIVELVGKAADALSSGERAAIVFGGETTVAVPSRGAGRGGRNLDIAARVALGLRSRHGIAAISAGTDGVDGSSRAAGALVDGGTADRCELAGLPLGAALEAFDTEPALEAARDLVVTGPTGTNVGDLVVVVATAS